jgi:hypothetical protein
MKTLMAYTFKPWNIYIYMGSFISQLIRPKELVLVGPFRHYFAVGV